MTTEPTAEKMYEFIDRFTKIYDSKGNELNPIPENKKVTVWCAGTHEQGFVYNIYKFDMGIEQLIAKKWILQEDLEKLMS